MWALYTTGNDGVWFHVQQRPQWNCSTNTCTLDDGWFHVQHCNLIWKCSTNTCTLGWVEDRHGGTPVTEWRRHEACSDEWPREAGWEGFIKVFLLNLFKL
jgi:hypothetical protein